MVISKLSPQVQLALRYQNILPYTAFLGISGEAVGQEIWTLLVRYTGEIEEVARRLEIAFEKINENFAIVEIPKVLVESLSNEDSIAYIAFPEVMTYILENTLNSICITEAVLNQGDYVLTGKDVLVAIIDSGIDYTHEDFRTANNKSRVAFLWDQNGEGAPPTGFKQGTEYTNEEINRALSQPTEEEQLAIVPSQDTLGHGTALAGIVGGNGRRSNGRYRGIAIESEFLIVKLKENPDIPVVSRGPRNIDIMLGLKYVAQKAKALKKPISVLIGLGINEGSHDGKSSLEIYMDQVMSRSKMCLSVGTGNEGNKDAHTQGVLRQDEEKTVQIFIDKDQPYYFLTLWKSFADTFSIKVQSPSGKITEELTDIVNNRAFVFDNTLVLVNFSEPSINNIDQQIVVFLERFESESINSGNWNLIVKGVESVEGQYHIWGSTIDPTQRLARFIEADPFVTLTIPSTAVSATSVGAFNSTTNQITNFSGRGYSRNGDIKPDLVAPGVDIMAPSNRNNRGYLPVTGTSAAAAFVCGAYAILMAYGILKQGDSFLYGERLKAYLVKNTKRLPQYAPYPNRQWGYGILCVEKVIKDLTERYKA